MAPSVLSISLYNTIGQKISEGRTCVAFLCWDLPFEDFCPTGTLSCKALTLGPNGSKAESLLCKQGKHLKRTHVVSFYSANMLFLMESIDSYRKRKKNLHFSSPEISTINILVYIFLIIKKTKKKTNLRYKLHCLLNMFITYMEDKITAK